MEFKDVKELIELVNNSELAYFEYTIGNAHIKMDKSMSRGNVENISNTQPVKVEEDVQIIKKVENVISVDSIVKEASSNDITGLEIKSPMVGTFYNSPSPEKPAFVEVGTMVKKGDTLCIVEAMKLMNEIESEVDGEVLKVLVNNGDMVEYGQPIFIIKEV